jgi:pimeloyl-[acyl-carrier protein] methyl ester esterase
MRTVWKVGGHRKLLLFFSGWAMDDHPTAGLFAEEMDICTCFDYADLETGEVERWRTYGEIALMAWSTGVWAAEQVLGKLDLPLSKAIAINGTPTTVQDETGIPRSVFQGTYDKLSPQSMQKFQRRMLGNAADYGRFLDVKPQRNLENQRDELQRILEADFEALSVGLIKWDKAIVGTLDAIFPPQNQLRYWTSRVPVLELDMPHFPFFYLNDWASCV